MKQKDKEKITKRTVEARRKQGETLKRLWREGKYKGRTGKVPWNKGLKGVCKANSGSFKKGNVPWIKGRKTTEETKMKLRAKLKGRILSSETISKMKGRIPWNKNKKVPSMTGELHPRWNGGRTISTDGYVEVVCKNHPYCNGKGYVKEHRLVMEKHLGRYLKPTEVVHHIDWDRQNNTIENLYLFENGGYHLVYHRFLRNLVGDFFHELGWNYCDGEWSR